MSTTAIIVIAVAAIALLALFVWLSRRSSGRREREVRRHREIAAGRHREAAEAVKEEAAVAEQRAAEARLEARQAEAEARTAQERAELHQGRADLHERGLADHELVDENGEPLVDTTRTEQPGRFDVRDERDTVIGDDDGRRGQSRFTRTDESSRTEEQEPAVRRPPAV
jgi:FtsZ-interacting cell division protein ZipA